MYITLLIISLLAQPLLTFDPAVLSDSPKKTLQPKSCPTKQVCYFNESEDPLNPWICVTKVEC